MKEIYLTAKHTKSEELSSQRTEQDGFDFVTFGFKTLRLLWLMDF
jgi:hypothetical protein